MLNVCIAYHAGIDMIALLQAEMKLRQNFSIIIPLQGMECLQALPGSIRELWILVHLWME